MESGEKTHLLKAERGILKSLSRSYQSENSLLDETVAVADYPDAIVSGEYESLGTSDSSSATQSTRTLGTFQGVFAPVSLSMLSSILFLRVGYIVGNAGLLEAFLQYGIAYSILISTVLSICAIATNGAVEGGGVYFMISRTLGMEFGGSIGILFWFANIVSSALYLAACTEGLIGNFGPKGSLTTFLPSSRWWNFAYSSLFNSINLFVCLIGSKLFGKTSALILSVVMICTVVTTASFFVNLDFHEDFVYNSTQDCIPPTDNISLPNCTKTAQGTFMGFMAASPEYISDTFEANLDPKFEFDCSDPMAEVNFFTVFGVLFSGVTGIMSGANMSGELLSPGKNIPRGTLAACFFTFTIFIVLSVLTALTCNPAMLMHDCMYLSNFSVWPPIVAIGVLLATFSASLNNLIGASRVLEAVAKDVLFGHILSFFTKGTIKDNPISSILVTWCLVEMFLLMGSLNSIAQLSSVLFLMSYAAVNLACLGLDLASAPNFRPSFKYFSWHTSLVGLLGTTIMMFFVSPLFSAVALLLCLSLIFALNFISPIRKPNWGSISQALLFHQVRKYLLLLDPRKAHVKFWRPQILLLVSNPRTCCSLIDFVNALKKGGLYVIGHVYTERLQDSEDDPCVVKNDHWLSLIDHLKIKAFVELTMASTLREGIQHLVRISGIGAMKPNTIILGYLDERFHGDDFNSPYSPFATRQFEGIFPELKRKPTQTHEDTRPQEKMNKSEYVGIICDVLKMQKNICLSRHFSLLDKGTLFRTDRQSIFGTRVKKKLYLDVWLVDFFSPFETDISDTTSLFLLQLACIVHMVPRWKKLTLRVFITVRDHRSSLHNQEEMLKNMLELLRVEAESHVLNWTPESTELSTDPHVQLSNEYLSSACETVRRRSQDTAVSFLYLPRPPKIETDYVFYLDALTALTQNWPPTLLVRGVSPVTSITL
ncbi:solute carrier family 12 member 9-like [Tigriopus californicus]|uniref:solute carrier family 12 member 9-like n=1 Tax=Tigriopus californicus TaxID=6832 RepID=UPI0027DA71D8|nr:solute carrier family 12 member 9-like [Tigriopus californicus]